MTLRGPSFHDVNGEPRRVRTSHRAAGHAGRCLPSTRTGLPPREARCPTTNARARLEKHVGRLRRCRRCRTMCSRPMPGPAVVSRVMIVCQTPGSASRTPGATLPRNRNALRLIAGDPAFPAGTGGGERAA
jgi:hypothetical protein